MDNWYFEMAKKYFDLKIYKVSDVRLFVQAERITKEQFTEITKESFDVVSLPSNIINNKVM
ncbi:XkdX family protein [Paraclostridium sordellii]|uniref:XkdX family protein n=1 Tax=Paraclostridium sordellii TaxID=1505 RepID=UPI0005DF668B|nr:XkdX family protein [Paeniclostridium sordellii]CEO27361.1 phage uncharacterized protein [[Clostridium] sordellii] [Paeniclostridium sordellii]CEP40839.1 phage uncharacterized protein [[Clostridium] sordellii] [Paeniclostridium sordellii]